MRAAAEHSWGLTVLACLAALAASACGGRAPTEKIAVGGVFPDTRLERLEGGRSASISDYQGKPLVVNFWATWCEPCRREMPDLERLSVLAHARGVTVLGITVDSDVNLAREFVLRHKITFPMLADRDMRFARDALGMSAFPETFLVGTDGRVRARLKGAREWTSPEAMRALHSVFDVDFAAPRLREPIDGRQPTRRSEAGT